VTDPPAGSGGASGDQRLGRAVAQLKSLLVPGETLEAYAVQHRLFATTHRRFLVAATTGRFIGMSRGLLGGFDPQDVRWQDLKDVRIRVGVLGADLTIVALANPDLAIAGDTKTLVFVGLQKSPAQQVYRICQAQEQAWREKRRLRELEELRAKSGGFHLASPPGAASLGVGQTVDAEDPTARLERAKQMLDRGLITDSEYETLKARIVSTL
jgi:Short C-terminal domain